MSSTTRQQVSQSVAQLMPHILRGIQLDFFVTRRVTQTQLLVMMAIRAEGRPAMGATPPWRGGAGGGMSPRMGAPKLPPRLGGVGLHCTMSVLAGNLHVSLPTMTGIVDRLVRDGYVSRTSEPTDRRQVAVALTSKGRQFVHDFQQVIRRRWEDVLSSLNRRELEAFYQVIAKLQAQMERTV